MVEPGSSDIGPLPDCVVCGVPGAVQVEPPRRTFARGADPSDPSYSVGEPSPCGAPFGKLRA